MAVTLSFVSIHAPAWGATCKYIKCSYKKGVSIHAPAWGATGYTVSLILLAQFQSTHPHGVRHEVPVYLPPTSQVSIHAPAWGATRCPAAAAPPHRVSIHAPAWGATGGKILSCGQLHVSIHAPAWGATYYLYL